MVNLLEGKTRGVWVIISCKEFCSYGTTWKTVYGFTTRLKFRKYLVWFSHMKGHSAPSDDSSYIALNFLLLFHFYLLYKPLNLYKYCPERFMTFKLRMLRWNVCVVIDLYFCILHYKQYYLLGVCHLIYKCASVIHTQGVPLAFKIPLLVSRFFFSYLWIFLVIDFFN